MKIYHVNKPVFLYNKEIKHTETRMFGSFGDIDKYLEKTELETKKRLGEDKSLIMVIYNISNMSGDELIVTANEERKPILFLRYKLLVEIKEAKIEEYK